MLKPGRLYQVQALAQASRDKMATSDLEQKVLTDDSAAKTARARLAEAQERVNEIRNRVRNLIESDPEIKSALQAMRDSAEDAEAAGTKVKRIRDKIAADAAKLNREQQQVKQRLPQPPTSGIKQAQQVLQPLLIGHLHEPHLMRLIFLNLVTVRQPLPQV